MLLLPDGITIGTVSGGCLERDVKIRARRTITEGQQVVVRYDSTARGEMARQLGLGCDGIVDVLMERLDAGVKNGPLELLRRCLTIREAGVIARVVAVEGQTAASVGNFLTVDQSGLCEHDFAEQELASQVQSDAATVLKEQRSRYATYRLPEGRVDTFLESVLPPPPLIVCGAGHDAVPLVRFAKELGWWVAVLDQPADATEEFVTRVPSASRGAAVIMSHSYRNDLRYLRALLPSPLRYLGVLGPKNRTERLLGCLEAEGLLVRPSAHTQRIYGPAGLDIGAESPAEIALAILAEIGAVIAGRTGQPLRDRQWPIHDRA
jgi:xanthine/CO dehydrogenase XdhC/CoxF family maturation factor